MSGFDKKSNTNSVQKKLSEYNKSIDKINSAKKTMHNALNEFAKKRKTLKTQLVDKYTRTKYGTRLPTPPKTGVKIRAKSIKLPTPPNNRVKISPDLEELLGDVPLPPVRAKSESSYIDLEKELADIPLKKLSPLDLEKELGHIKTGGKRTRRRNKRTN